jgi:hypothetical protein
MLSGAWSWMKDLVGMGNDPAAMDQAALAAQLNDITMLHKMKEGFGARIAEMTAAWQPFKDSLAQGFENVFNLMSQTGGMIRTVVIPAVNELAASLTGIASGVQAVAMAGGIQVNIPQATRAMAASPQSSFPTTFAHATGGIFDTPHIGWVAEDSKREAIIPLEDRSRGIPLWMAAGEDMGMQFGGKETTNNITRPAPAINITIYGGDAGIAQRVGEEVRRVLREMQEYEERVSFA